MGSVYPKLKTHIGLKCVLSLFALVVAVGVQGHVISASIKTHQRERLGGSESAARNQQVEQGGVPLGINIPNRARGFSSVWGTPVSSTGNYAIALFETYNEHDNRSQNLE